MIKISIIVPMYNVAQYLDNCIESVYRQNLEEDTFEVILVDDQSQDGSRAIAGSLIKNHTNARIISHPVNKGLGGARNTGIMNAAGRYLVFWDADDWFLPGMLAQLYDEAEKYSVDVLEFGAQGIGEKNKIVYTRSLSSDKINNGINYYKKYRYMDSACNKLYKRSFLLQNGLLFVERLYIEDYEFNTRAFYVAQKVFGIKLIAAQFYQSPDSITRNIDDRKSIKMREDIVQMIKLVRDFFKKQPNKENKEVSEYFGQRLSYLTATLFFQLFKSRSLYSNFEKLKYELKKNGIFFVDHRIYDLKKDLFRRVLLKHFYLFKTIRFIK
ncbi:glycosyltransferase family 2 protein [uncultured Mucilaginibacter sp.]|uniref:glycosyltransferase family 2 protein n=1 Tax=uncultured Mucilaginibacter sp. TaxID=797541 RepID=UPI0025FF76D6|nr:glycosyltransferase family 2 protein [uncultured Mucilaginibacter sp.]